MKGADYWHAGQTVVGELLGRRGFLPLWSADLESGESLGIKKGLICLLGDYWSSPNSKDRESIRRLVEVT